MSMKPGAEEWRIAFRAIGLLAAQTVQGRLETAGIPAVLDYDGTKSVLGIPTFAGTGEVRILVPLDRIAEARELLGADSEPDEDLDE
ncbi:hypothetical protein TFLX_04750 [Thermoflexales bacterium]|nr:hypothetical protein TFLX_04750 [Thermoflexales bacterium]